MNQTEFCKHAHGEFLSLPTPRTAPTLLNERERERGKKERNEIIAKVMNTYINRGMVNLAGSLFQYKLIQEHHGCMEILSNPSL